MWNNLIGTYAQRGARNGVLIGTSLSVLAAWSLYEYLARGLTAGEMVAGGLFAVCAVAVLYRFTPRLVNIEVSPSISRLSRYGVPITVAQVVDMELSANSRTITLNRFGRIIICDGWIVRPHFWGVDVCALRDVTWAYERVTRHYNWFIPIGRTNEVVMHGASPPETFSCTAKQAAAVLAELRLRAPYLLLGWTQNREDAWNHDPHAMIAFVESERQAHLASDGDDL